MAYQYPLNGGRINASIGGNSTSAGAGYSLISTGTMLLAGGNNITLSQNGSAVTISGGNGVALYDGVNSISSGTARISAGGGLTASINGQTLSLSAPAQSSLSATGIFSISANGSTISMGAPAYSAGISTNGNTSGTTGFATNQLLFAGGNNITLSQATGAGGNTLTISAANQSVQTQSVIQGIIASGSTNNTGNISFANSNGVTFGLSNNTLTASVAAGAGGGVALANSQTTYTSGTVNLLEGGGAVTIASSAGGQSFKISVPTVSSLSATGAVSISNNAGTISIGAPAFSAGMSTLGNTSGTTGTVSNQLIFAGGNNITLSQSTGAGGNTLSISAPASSSLSGTGIISISRNASTISIGAPAFSAGISNIGNTAGTTGTASNQVIFAGGNNITLSQSTGAGGNTLSISAANQTNQTLGLYGGGNTTGQSSSSTFDARTLSFQGAGAASVGYSNGSVVISAPNAAAGNVTFSAGTASAGLGSLVFSNSNGVSFGLSGSTITASAAGGAGGGIALANSQTTYTSGTANLNVAGGALTIASTTGQSFNFSVPATSSLSVTGALSLSTNGSTVSIGAPASSSIVATGGLLSVSTNVSTISLGIPGHMQYHMHNSAAMYSSSTSAMVNNSVSLVRMLIPQHLSFTRVEIPVTVSGGTSATANTAGWAFSSVGVLYSRNGSTLNPIIGQSSNTTYSYYSSSTASFNGPRMVSFGLATTLSAGEYYFGVQISTATSSMGTATTAPALTFAPIYGTSYSAAPWQGLGSATNATINLYQPLQGMNSVTISNTSQTFQQSQITQSGATAIRANLVVLFRNN